MIYNDDTGVPAELIRVANQMRKDNDPIGDDRGRIRWNFSLTESDAELTEVLSALPPEELRATYEWLSPPDSDGSDSSKKVERRFVEAYVDEVSGKREQALQIYRSLETETKNSDPLVSKRVREAVRRVSH